MKNFIKKETRFSYAELDMLFNAKLRQIEKDAEMLAKYGIKQFDIVSLHKLKNEFSDSIMDPEMVLNQKVKTAVKNDIKEDLIRKIIYVKGAMTRAKLIDVYYEVLPVMTNLKDQKDGNLYRSGKLIYHQMVVNQDLLLEFGVTKQFTEDFLVLTESLGLKIYEVKSKMAERTNQTRSRRETANEVWDLLQDICTTGRMVWLMEDNATKYNEYVLPKFYRKKTKPDFEQTAIGS